MRVAVIPARGGSKRVPRKNVRLFHGQPMIAWSIIAAKESKAFDRVIVSTDDSEIAEIAKTFEAETPFIRPNSLADDYTPTIPVIAHAINWLKDSGADPTEVCCIYATAPFIQPTDLVRGLDLLLSNNADYSFPVTSYAFPIQRSLRIMKDSRVQMLWPEKFESRSQDLEECWHDAGQFYWGRSGAWISGVPIFSQNSVALPIPRFRVQDIDTFEDWEHAEFIFRATSAFG